MIRRFTQFGDAIRQGLAALARQQEQEFLARRLDQVRGTLQHRGTMRSARRIPVTPTARQRVERCVDLLGVASSIAPTKTRRSAGLRICRPPRWHDLPARWIAASSDGAVARSARSMPAELTRSGYRSRGRGMRGVRQRQCPQLLHRIGNDLHPRAQRDRPVDARSWCWLRSPAAVAPGRPAGLRACLPEHRHAPDRPHRDTAPRPCRAGVASRMRRWRSPARMPGCARCAWRRRDRSRRAHSSIRRAQASQLTSVAALRVNTG